MTGARFVGSGARWRKSLLRLAAVLLLMVGCVGCDQASKQIARRALADSSRVSLLGDALRFELAENPGAFLSLGAELPAAARRALFGILAPVGFGIVALALLRSRSLSRTQMLGLALMLAGAAGNWLDRFTNHGAVVDFVSLGIGPLRTGIFNLADVEVLAGLVALAWRPQRRPAGAADSARGGTHADR